MTPEIQRCSDEAIKCATLLLAGHPEQHGLRMAVSDWIAEELILRYPEAWNGTDSDKLR